MGENRLGLRAKQFYKHAPSVRKSARCKWVKRSREYGAANLHCQSMADSNSGTIGARPGYSVEGAGAAFSVGRRLSGWEGSSLGNGDDHAGAGLRAATAVAVRDGRVEIDGVFGLQNIFIAADLDGERPL
jgi:hypothetical protein